MLQEWKVRGSQKRFLMGHFVTPDQWENRERDGRTSSWGTHHRSWSYEVAAEKNGGDFWGGQGPEGVVAPQMEMSCRQRW